jgi:hypothetical protein
MSFRVSHAVPVLSAFTGSTATQDPFLSAEGRAIEVGGLNGTLHAESAAARALRHHAFGSYGAQFGGAQVDPDELAAVLGDEEATTKLLTDVMFEVSDEADQRTATFPWTLTSTPTSPEAMADWANRAWETTEGFPEALAALLDGMPDSQLFQVHAYDGYEAMRGLAAVNPETGVVRVMTHFHGD